MAGQTRLLILACCAAATAFGQTPATPTPATPSSPLPKRPGVWLPGAHRPAAEALSPEFADVRKAIDALTPEQRQRFVENFKRWANLSPEERKALADRESFRRKKMAEDIDSALNEAGLQLDGERRAQFAKRYGEERRKIEEQLRRDIEEKRRPLLKEIVAKLKTEFSTSEPAPIGR
jgi:hypothetical protein